MRAEEVNCGRPVSWDEVSKQMKIAWASLRNLALEAVPELKDRLPHFSEFEPLKSYNADYLLKKKAGQQKIVT